MTTAHYLAALSVIFTVIAVLVVWKKRTLLSAILLGFVLFLSFLLYQKEFSYEALTRKMYQAFENHEFHNSVVYARQRMNYARSNFPETSVDYAQAVHDLAFTYKSYECLQEDAEGLFREALAIFQKSLGEKSQLVAQTYDNLAIVLGYLDRPKDAAESSEKSLEVYEALQGPEGYDVYLNLTNLAGHYLTMKDCEKAEKLITRSAALGQKLFPQGHPFDIRTYQFQASLLQCRGNLQEAIAPIQAALAVIEKTRQDPQRLQQDLLLSLAFLQLELKQYDAAESTLLQLQELIEGFGRGYYIVENTEHMLKELRRKRSGSEENALNDEKKEEGVSFLVCEDKDFAGGFWVELKRVIMREVEIAQLIWKSLSRTFSKLE